MKANRFRVRGSHPLWPAFPCRSAIDRLYDFTSSCISLRTVPTTPRVQRYAPWHTRGFGLFRVRSPLLAESLLFSLPGATKMFQFAPYPPAALFYSRAGARVLNPGGFPHSEICGSTDICSFPQLIAACRVLLRLLMPRHSPCALHSLTLLFEAEFFTDKI